MDRYIPRSLCIRNRILPTAILKIETILQNKDERDIRENVELLYSRIYEFTVQRGICFSNLPDSKSFLR